MSTPQKFNYAQGDTHYQNRQNANNRYEVGPLHKKNSRSTSTLQQSNIFQERTSWKNHINPEITKLYEEISLSQSYQDTYTPKTSRYTQKQLRQWPNTPHRTQVIQSSQSRLQLLQDIEKHEEYLRQNSGVNLYIPNSASILKFRYKSSDNSQRHKFVSKMKNTEFDEHKHGNLEDMLRTQAESKMLTSKHCDSTTARQHVGNFRQIELRSSIGKQKKEEMSQLLGHNQVTRPKWFSAIDKAKIHMSHAERNPKKYEVYNNNLTLFQKQASQQSQPKSHSINNKIVFQQQINQFVKINSIDHIQVQQQNRNQYFQSSYGYELMKQECNFLRNKYIQHIQSKHDTRL